MRTKLLASIMFVLAAGLLFTQCSSDRYFISTRNMAPDRDEYDVEATLVFMTDEALLERFGPLDNPYLSPKTLVSGSDIIAFEVTIKNNTAGGRTVIVPLENIRMVVGNSAYTPINSYKLSSFWHTFLDKDQDTSIYRSTPGKMRFMINETMFTNPAIINSGEIYSGVVAFMGRFTKFGFAEINIPVFDKQSRVIGIFNEEFERY